MVLVHLSHQKPARAGQTLLVSSWSVMPPRRITWPTKRLAVAAKPR